MHLKIVAVGNKMPGWVNIACQDYLARFPNDMKWQCVEIPLGKRKQSSQMTTIINKESQQLLQAISADEWVVALDMQGKQHNSTQLADKILHWQQLSKTITFIIGGPEGFHPDCLQRANETWSLSSLTLPHPMVRIILLEQCFRAWSILHNHPYHR